MSERGVPVRAASFVAILLSGAAAAWLGAVGNTWQVDETTCPASGSGTLNDPFCRIQDAICLAGAGDTVLVAPGTYREAIRMRPGVSVVSSAGPMATTIDASAQPCTDNDFCTKRAGTQCSVVTFASGHTNSSVLDGFTITGGAGLIQSNMVAGGGIFVFSSPRIANNVITNNVLSGPLPQGRTLRGAGLYVSVGQPIISNNTISGNRAIPPAGATGSVTYGYGGGLWVGFYSAPVVTSNVIQGNQAGDPNAAYSLGSGGGLVIWPGAGSAGALVDGNVIGDNLSDSMGGGISLLSIAGTTAESVVTNNIIVGNNSKFGGGVYTYFNRSSTINNTITDNEAFIGGGLFTGPGDPNLPVTITNNVITGNRLRQFGTGGGIYTLDFSATFEPAIRHNDLWGNEKNQCDGERTDATCIGVDGNFAGDPLFTDAAGRDFTLDPSSPAIDRADAAAAPAIDIDGVTRGFDGDGVPDSPALGDVDVGAHEFAPGCVVTGAEVCDGVDNDCNDLVDDGFPDSDADGLADCVDPDDDADGVPDASDCAPLNATAFGVPVEVSGLDVVGESPTVVSFDQQAIGSGTSYEVVSGLLGRLQATDGFQESFCAAMVVGSPWQDGRPAPGPGEGWYYEVRSVNACGHGTLGSALRDAPGAGDVCQAGVVDGDNDGSPSDLDCDDADASRSPNSAEVCDGVDNDCDQIADDGNPGGGVACGVSEVGECRLGVTSCSGGTVVCGGAVGPQPESCDGLDNDCDAATDEDLGTTTCGVGECRTTVQNCVGGVTQTCTPGSPAAEICDGLDNDCDGKTDEGNACR